MFNEITFYPVLGLPLIVYGGILTFLCFLFTAFIAVMNSKGNTVIAPKWHPRMAKISILLAIVHGGLGLLAYL
ncbi:MAG: hypothetical protein QXK06_05020 [Candidatus Diapherotrites archaeon]